jgi:hypothetical protein
MPNVIKSATTVSAGTIKRNNFLLGIDTSLVYGPTDNGVVTPEIDVTSTRTFFWNGIDPIAGGYVLYNQKSSGGPSIFVATGDTQLIQYAIQNGGSNINTATAALNYFNGLSNFLVTNIEYPNIVTSGLTLLLDAGFVPSYPRTGTTWNDLSGSNANGTLQGSTLPTYSSSFGGGMNFTASTSEVSVGSINVPGRITTCAWVRHATVPATIQRYVTTGSELAVIRHNGSGQFQFYITTSGTIKIMSVASQIAVNTNYYFCGTWDGTTMRSYRNGVSIGTPSTPGGTMSNTNVGSLLSSAFGEPMNGIIFSTQIYNRALSATEILQNYDAMVSRYSLLLHWDISNPNSYPGTGTTVFDLSGNGNNGTITGGVTYSTSNGGILTTNGTTGYINSTTPNLASTNYTVIGASRYSGVERGRMINASVNNWLLGNWSNTVANYYAEGWVSPAVGTGASDTTWRIYTGTGNIAGDSYAFYINSVLTNGPNNGGSQGPNGITVGRYNPGASEYSAGDFSFLLVFNAILSQSEITRIYNLYRTRFSI